MIGNPIRCTIGIDLGESGGIALRALDTPTRAVSWQVTSWAGAPHLLRQVLARAVGVSGAALCLCVIERPLLNLVARPSDKARRGAAGGIPAHVLAQLHYLSGLCCGMCFVFNVAYETPLPSVWTAEMGCQGGKEAHIRAAAALWPEGPFKGPRGGLRDGLADAVLLAEWGSRRQGV